MQNNPSAGSVPHARAYISEHGLDIIPEALFGDMAEDELCGVSMMRARASGGLYQAYSGFFDSDHLMVAAAHAARYDQKRKYMPHISTGLFSRPLIEKYLAGFGETMNKLYKSGKGRSVRAKNVKCRRNLFVDIDPIDELFGEPVDHEFRRQWARESANFLREHTRSLGWPDPIYCCSGNGMHLLYRLDDLPADKHTQRLARGAQDHLNAIVQDTFDGRLKVDKLTDSARLTKFYGVQNKKGGRLGIRSGVEDVPDGFRDNPITEDMLQAVCPAPVVRSPPRPSRSSGCRHGSSGEVAGGDAQGVIEQFLVEYPKEYDVEGGSHKWNIPCPYNLFENGEHTEGGPDDITAAIWLAGDGTLTGNCHHSCIGKHDRKFWGLEMLWLIAEGTGVATKAEVIKAVQDMQCRINGEPTQDEITMDLFD